MAKTKRTYLPGFNVYNSGEGAFVAIGQMTDSGIVGVNPSFASNPLEAAIVMCDNADDVLSFVGISNAYDRDADTYTSKWAFHAQNSSGLSYDLITEPELPNNAKITVSSIHNPSTPLILDDLTNYTKINFTKGYGDIIMYENTVDYELAHRFSELVPIATMGSIAVAGDAQVTSLIDLENTTYNFSVSDVGKWILKISTTNVETDKYNYELREITGFVSSTELTHTTFDVDWATNDAYFIFENSFAGKITANGPGVNIVDGTKNFATGDVADYFIINLTTRRVVKITDAVGDTITTASGVSESGSRKNVLVGDDYIIVPEIDVQCEWDSQNTSTTLTTRSVNLNGSAPNNVFRGVDNNVVVNKIYYRGHWISDSNPLNRVDITQATITNGLLVINSGSAFGAFEDVDGFLALIDENGAVAAIAYNAQVSS